MSPGNRLSQKLSHLGATQTLILLAAQDQSPLPVAASVPRVVKDALRMNETGYQIRGGNRWERQSRASTLSNPCSGSHLAVFRTLLCRRYVLSAGSNGPIENDQS
jgi:hypothetical protein